MCLLFLQKKPSGWRGSLPMATVTSCPSPCCTECVLSAHLYFQGRLTSGLLGSNQKQKVPRLPPLPSTPTSLHTEGTEPLQTGTAVLGNSVLTIRLHPLMRDTWHPPLDRWDGQSFISLMCSQLRGGGHHTSCPEREARLVPEGGGDWPVWMTLQVDSD